MLDPMESHLLEKRKRATRRFRKVLKKKRVYQWVKRYIDDDAWAKEAASKLADNPHICDNPLCCNHKRKAYGPKVSEKKYLQEKPEDQIDE